jgi:hypothetical protein
VTDKRARCNEPGLGHGEMCVLRPGHEGDHHHQPKGFMKSAARTWPKKPTLSDGVKKPEGLPGAKDYRTSKDDGKGDQRTTRDE